MINVTKTYLPDINKYKEYVDRIYASNYLTNYGPLVQELEEKLKSYLGVKNLILVSNGTLALQVAYRALHLKGEVITSPFSFVATASSIIWENLNPIFSDIDPLTFNMDPLKIEEKINEFTSCIVPVHVFGNPCEVNEINRVAQKNNLKVIYDAAHAFGVKLNGQSVLNFGDLSTLSFHSTKIFHSIEGGAIITQDDDLAKQIRVHINFGIPGPDKVVSLGINAKMNEFEAAMGLCVLEDMDIILRERAMIWETYYNEFHNIFQMQAMHANSTNNYNYFPVLFEDEKKMLEIRTALNEKDIYPRRYFYPSLDTLEFIRANSVCKNSRSISSRVLCLPIYPGLNAGDQNLIIETIKRRL